MDDDKITLNQLFGLPKESFARQALSVGIEKEEMDSLKGLILATVAGLQWSAIEAQIVQKISDLLNMDVIDVICKTWQQYGVLAEYADKSKTSGKSEFVELIDHTMKFGLQPFLEIQFAGIVKKIFFDVNLAITVKGLKLTIADARIRAVHTGSWEGEGEISVKDVSLLTLPLGHFEIPGQVDLGDGIPIV